MPMRYAHQGDVLRQLKIKDDDAAAIERVTRLENGLADVFDAKVGRTFVTEPVLPETRDMRGMGSDLLVLPVGARGVAAVAVGGTWDGLLWVDETALDPADWTPWGRDAQGKALGLQRLDGDVWWGPVRVTALWGDQDTEGVPADVVAAMTFVTVDQYRIEQASPAGELGPEGMIVPVRNPWRYTLVAGAIERHKVQRRKAGV